MAKRRKKRSGVCRKERVTIEGRSTASGKAVSFMRKTSACGKAKSGWNKAKTASGRAAQKAGLESGRRVLKDVVKYCKRERRIAPGSKAWFSCVGSSMKNAARKGGF